MGLPGVITPKLTGRGHLVDIFGWLTSSCFYEVRAVSPWWLARLSSLCSPADSAAKSRAPRRTTPTSRRPRSHRICAFGRLVIWNRFSFPLGLDVTSDMTSRRPLLRRSVNLTRLLRSKHRSPNSVSCRAATASAEREIWWPAILKWNST